MRRVGMGELHGGWRGGGGTLLEVMIIFFFFFLFSNINNSTVSKPRLYVAGLSGCPPSRNSNSLN